jgi:hypothetical protein
MELTGQAEKLVRQAARSPTADSGARHLTQAQRCSWRGRRRPGVVRVGLAPAATGSKPAGQAVSGENVAPRRSAPSRFAPAGRRRPGRRLPSRRLPGPRHAGRRHAGRRHAARPRAGRPAGSQPLATASTTSRTGEDRPGPGVPARGVASQAWLGPGCYEPSQTPPSSPLQAGLQSLRCLAPSAARPVAPRCGPGAEPAWSSAAAEGLRSGSTGTVEPARRQSACIASLLGLPGHARLPSLLTGCRASSPAYRQGRWSPGDGPYQPANWAACGPASGILRDDRPQTSGLSLAAPSRRWSVPHRPAQRQRSPPVADGSKEPEVAGRPAHAAGATRTGDSDCIPTVEKGWSASRSRERAPLGSPRPTGLY